MSDHLDLNCVDTKFNERNSIVRTLDKGIEIKWRFVSSALNSMEILTRWAAIAVRFTWEWNLILV